MHSLPLCDHGHGQLPGVQCESLAPDTSDVTLDGLFSGLVFLSLYSALSWNVPFKNTNANSERFQLPSPHRLKC